MIATATPVSTASEPRLVEVTGGRVFTLGDVTTIGRDPEAAVCLSDMMVGKRHAEVRRLEDGRFELSDLGSRHGTYVGGRRVTKVVLEAGDEILIGGSRLRYEKGSPPAVTPTPGTVRMDGGGLGTMMRRLSVWDANRFAPASQIVAPEELARDYEKLRAALEVSRTIGVEHDLTRLLERLLATAFDLLPAERGAVLLLDGNTGGAVAEVSRTRTGDREALAPAVQPHPGGAAAAGRGADGQRRVRRLLQPLDQHRRAGHPLGHVRADAVPRPGRRRRPRQAARDPRGHVPRLQAGCRRLQPARPGPVHQHRQPGGAGAQERGARPAHPRGQGGRGQAARAGGAQPAGRRHPARQRASHHPDQPAGRAAARSAGRAARRGRARGDRHAVDRRGARGRARRARDHRARSAAPHPGRVGGRLCQRRRSGHRADHARRHRRARARDKGGARGAADPARPPGRRHRPRLQQPADRDHLVRPNSPCRARRVETNSSAPIS